MVGVKTIPKNHLLTEVNGSPPQNPNFSLPKKLYKKNREDDEPLSSTSYFLSYITTKIRTLHPQLHWFNILYLGLVHLWAVVGLFTALPSASFKSLLWCVFLHFLYGLGVTAGAHRLWSHRSYSATVPVKIFLMLCSCGANQGSIWHWCRDHRAHHIHSDTPKDPHNSEYGMFYSHCGWLFLKKETVVVEAGRAVNMEDLKKDEVVMFQKKYYFPLAMFFCFGLPTLIPIYFWGEHWLTSLTLSYIKYAFMLNATWCVNSLAHFYGMRPYRPESPTAENWFVALIAIGEGWHNYHHAYPWDYATSEYGASVQFNPSKMFIDGCAAVGLVSDVSSFFFFFFFFFFFLNYFFFFLYFSYSFPFSREKELTTLLV